MEVGRRFGNQVGDPLESSTPDIRGSATAQGFIVSDIQPPTAWQGPILAYINERPAGSYVSDPFFLRTVIGQRVFFEFFLAGPRNHSEDVSRYLRSVPGDRLRLDFSKTHPDHNSFRIYHTAGLTNTPDVRLTELFIKDREAGSTTTAAQFVFVSEVLPEGGHSVQVRPADRAGNEHTGCPVLTAILSPWPQPPTGVEVHAYSAVAGLVTVKWSGPAGASTGSVVRAYRDAGIDDAVDYGTEVASAAHPFATTGTPPKPYVQVALPGTGPAAVGTWVIGLRHDDGVVEEDNVSALARFTIQSDGDFEPLTPLPPSLVEALPKEGGRIVVRVKHDNAEEPLAAERFWVYRALLPGSTSIDYGNTHGTIVRGGDRFFVGTLGFPGLTDGAVFAFAARAVAAGDVTETNTGIATAMADATPPTSCPTSVALSKVLQA